jgi:hypothetical protein
MLQEVCALRIMHFKSENAQRELSVLIVSFVEISVNSWIDIAEMERLEP